VIACLSFLQTTFDVIYWFGRCLDADVEWHYKFISNPNWRVSINQSFTGQSLSHIDDVWLIYSTSKSTTKARSYFVVYSSDVFSTQFNNDVNTNVTLRNFILWSTSQVKFYIHHRKNFTTDWNLSRHYCCKSGGIQKTRPTKKDLLIARIDKSFRCCCAHG
jgi:hypothetical protein